MEVIHFRDYLCQYLAMNKICVDREDRKCNESMTEINTKELHAADTISEKYKILASWILGISDP